MGDARATIADAMRERDEITEGGKYTAREHPGVWLRFGDLPENGHSHDHAHGEDLDGVSVYTALLRGIDYNLLSAEDVSDLPAGEVVLVAPKSLPHSYNGGIKSRLHDRTAYLVVGRTIGRGPDGEPVIDADSAEVVAELGHNVRGELIWRVE